MKDLETADPIRRESGDATPNFEWSVPLLVEEGARIEFKNIGTPISDVDVVDVQPAGATLALAPESPQRKSFWLLCSAPESFSEVTFALIYRCQDIPGRQCFVWRDLEHSPPCLDDSAEGILPGSV